MYPRVDAASTTRSMPSSYAAGRIGVSCCRAHHDPRPRADRPHPPAERPARRPTRPRACAPPWLRRSWPLALPGIQKRQPPKHRQPPYHFDRGAIAQLVERRVCIGRPPVRARLAPLRSGTCRSFFIYVMNNLRHCEASTRQCFSSCAKAASSSFGACFAGSRELSSTTASRRPPRRTTPTKQRPAASV